MSIILLTNRKSHGAFDRYRHRWTWLILNGVIAIILLYFAEFDSFAGRLRRIVVEDRR